MLHVSSVCGLFFPLAVDRQSGLGTTLAFQWWIRQPESNTSGRALSVPHDSQERLYSPGAGSGSHRTLQQYGLR